MSAEAQTSPLRQKARNAYRILRNRYALPLLRPWRKAERNRDGGRFAISPSLLREALLLLADHDKNYMAFVLLGLDAELLKEGAYSDDELTQRMLRYRGHPSTFGLLVQMATYFTNSGHHELAVRFYREILKRRPDKTTHSMALQNQLIWEGSTSASLLAAHKEWADVYCAGIEPLKVNWRSADPGRKIRVGYTCHFFYGGASTNSLLPMLERHDRARFEIYCYDDGETPEEWKRVADVWRDIRGMSDEKVARMMTEDQLDMLQEMNGHCAINRMGVVARRPAPIQINWYNHASTTAIPGMTHITSDRICVPDEDLQYFTETLYRLDRFYGAVALAGQFENLSPEPPMMKNGYVTFANLGSPHKYTQSCIALWARVLKAVPDSKLLIKGGVLDYLPYRKSFHLLFEANGIARERILMEGYSKHAEMMDSFNRADIMLDTFPVTGGTTMFEALWNGIPPVTLRGNRWVSRYGASTLTTLGCTELISETPEEYVAKAAALAADPACVAEYRRSLRGRMAVSTLTDPENYRRDVEQCYVTLWQEWCDSQRASKAA